MQKASLIIPGGGFPENIWEVFGEISKPIRGLFLDTSEENSAARLSCPYAPVISAGAMHCLRASPVDDDVDGVRLKELENCGLSQDGYSNIKQMLKGKYVLYGVHLQGLGDMYDVPIHDNFKLPGIFIHAMALDNLLETNGNVHFVKAKRSSMSKALYYSFSAFLATILFFSIRYAFFCLWHSLESEVKKSNSLICRFWCLVLELFIYWPLIVVIAGLCLILITWTVYLLSFHYHPFRFGVLNWVGIMLVSGLLSVWVKIPFAEGLAEVCHACARKWRLRRIV